MTGAPGQLGPLPLETRLGNGERILIREIGPADRPLLAQGFDRLSKQSRFFRFLGPHGALSEAELDRFSAQNTDTHFAIGAASIGTEADLPLATARFIRPEPGSSEAEIAVTIIDSHQRLGLGSLFLRCLAREGEARGLTTFSAMLHRENTGMGRLLARFGGHEVERAEESTWTLPLPFKVPENAGPRLTLPLRI